jgi:hypothetical protein
VHIYIYLYTHTYIQYIYIIPMLLSIGVSYTPAEPRTGSTCARTDPTRLTWSLFNRQPRVCFSHLAWSFPCGCQHCSSHRRLPAPCSPSVVRRHSIYKLALELGLDSQVGMGARSNVRASFLSGALDRVSARASGVSHLLCVCLLGSLRICCEEQPRHRPTSPDLGIPRRHRHEEQPRHWT